MILLLPIQRGRRTIISGNVLHDHIMKIGGGIEKIIKIVIMITIVMSIEEMLSNRFPDRSEPREPIFGLDSF